MVEHWVCRNCESVDGPTVEGDCALCREDSVQSPVVALVPAEQLRGAVEALREIATWAEYGYQDLNSGGVLSCVKKRAKKALDQYGGSN